MSESREDVAASPLRLDLDGKVVLVTGGSRGLGRAMVEGFAAAGAEVAIASRKAAACETVAQEVSERTGRRALGFGVHAGHWDECDRLVDQVMDAFGRIDVLVNNAGMSPVYDSVDGISEQLWDKVLDVNLKGPFRLSARVGRHMSDAGRGAIINISSTAATRPSAHIVPYSAAKAGLNALTLALAQALGPAVRVNAIMPGLFATDITASWDSDTFERFAGMVALRRAGEPHELVGAALLLASDHASYITGAVLEVHGGQP